MGELCPHGVEQVATGQLPSSLRDPVTCPPSPRRGLCTVSWKAHWRPPRPPPSSVTQPRPPLIPLSCSFAFKILLSACVYFLGLFFISHLFYQNTNSLNWVDSVPSPGFTSIAVIHGNQFSADVIKLRGVPTASGGPYIQYGVSF